MNTIRTLVAAALALLAPVLPAATVQIAGVISNNAGLQITQWRTAGTPKTLDADGDNLYGTTARVLFDIGQSGQGTVFRIDSVDPIVGPYGGYATVDGVNGGADVVVKTTTNNGVAGADRVMFTFTALAGCPANVRIGVATDGLDGAQFSPASIGLRQVGGSSAEQALTPNNTLDMVFFDVKGVAAGNQFQIFGDTGTGGFVTIQLVTFDAIPIVVTNTNDLGGGSLRAALATAAAQAGADTITFDPALNGKTIALSTSASDSAFTLANGEVVTVDASALSAGVKLDGGSQNFRFFSVNAGASLTLHGLTLVNGGGANFDVNGGAIDNGGTLTLTRCTLSGNRADGIGGTGGAIVNGGTLTLTHCTLSGNRANANGGAIYNVGTLTLTHCTLSGNTSGGFGSGICNARGLATLTHCTLSGNTAPAGKGSGVASFGNADVETRVQNCIISGNTNSNVDFIVNVDSVNTFTSLGGNLIGSGNATGDFTGAGDIINNTPLLASLGNYGGPTQTRPPLPQAPTSPAIDAATAIAGLTTDQRGVARGAAIYTNDFSNGLGGATVLAGALDSGSFRLTPEVGDQAGTLVLPTVGSLAGGFALTFDYLFAKAEPTNAFPADGMSVSIGPAPGAFVNDSGVPGTPRVRFDIYNGGGPVNGVIYYIRPDGTVGQSITTALSRDKATNGGDRNVFRAVRIDFTAGGDLTVRYKGAVVFGPIATGYTVQAGDTITFGARTGGLTAEQRIDNIGLLTQPVGVADIGATEALSGPVNAVVTSNLDAGPGTLRDILNAVPSGSTITFDPAVFTGALATTNTISLATSQLDTAFTLDKAVTIDATAIPGGVKLDGGSQDFRFFAVSPGASLTLHGLTLTGGGAANFGGDAGAISNYGTATLTRCTLSGNRADFGGDAGAISNYGTATLTGCTLSGNSADGRGGAILSFGTLTLTHCTLSGNTCGVYGGGICNALGLTTLTHCTLSGNTAGQGDGSGVASFGNANTETVVQNCIISGNTNSSVDVIGGATNTFRSLGGNLIGTGNAIGDFNVAGNILSNTPQLAPLADYGGPTQTMALLPGSPARNAAAVLSPVITSDQRGFAITGLPDIGAYEAGTFTNYNAWIYETLPTSTPYAWNAPVPDAQHASTFDADGDGATNGNEWIARTGPGNATDYLRITSAVRSGANVILSFPSVTGRTYTLWQSDTLTGFWTNTGQTAVSGNGSAKTFTVPAPVNGVPKRFHRVQVGP